MPLKLPMKKKKSPKGLLGDSIRRRMKKNNGPGAKKRITNTRQARNGNGSGNNSQLAYPLTHELAREEAIQRYVELYDFAPTGYVSFDRSGRIAEINLAAARLFGLHRERLIGLPFARTPRRNHTAAQGQKS